MNKKALMGPSIQVDPLFPYYQNRSCESIADEIERAGYKLVHYFVVNEAEVNRELIEAFRRKGIVVWAMVLGNGAYSTGHLPGSWPEWRMVLLNEPNDGFTRFSHFSEAYVDWKKLAVARLVRTYPFDGLEIAEPYLPEWGGIERGVYGDVGPHAKRKFKEICGLDIPEFRDQRSTDYYKKNPDTYARWVQFRVDAVNDLIHEIINGEGGAREVRPDLQVATWSLAVDAGSGSIPLLREYQGLDAPSMIAKVCPDLHYLQTHWPDWTKRKLPADYIVQYEPFVSQIRSAFPDLPLAVQTDIGSSKSMVRSLGWLRQFQEHAQRLGYAASTAYEYHIGGFMYEEPPKPVQAIRVDNKRLIIAFTKRVDANSASQARHYRFIDERSAAVPVRIRIRHIIVDGSRVIIETDGLPDGSFQVECANITDTPQLWLFKGSRPNSVPAGAGARVKIGAR